LIAFPSVDIKKFVEANYTDYIPAVIPTVKELRPVTPPNAAAVCPGTDKVVVVLALRGA